jgi:hypothetical protein
MNFHMLYFIVAIIRKVYNLLGLNIRPSCRFDNFDFLNFINSSVAIRTVVFWIRVVHVNHHDTKATDPQSLKGSSAGLYLSTQIKYTLLALRNTS